MARVRSDPHAARLCSSPIRKYPTTEKVRIDVLKRFGYYSHGEQRASVASTFPGTASGWTRSTSGLTCRSWINGETGGYLRVCTEGRNWFETDFPNWLQQEPPKFTPDKRSDEHGSYIIEALETGRTYRGHFNVPNTGIITNLPEWLHHRIAGLCGSQRHPHGAYRRPAPGVRGDLLCQRERAAHGHGGGGSRAM